MSAKTNRLGSLPLWLAAALMPAVPALAQEFQPYPSPKITVEQWKNYATQVRQNFESTAEIMKDMNLVPWIEDEGDKISVGELLSA